MQGFRKSGSGHQVTGEPDLGNQRRLFPVLGLGPLLEAASRTQPQNESVA